MSSYIKSIMATQHKGQWCCRVRLVQGKEVFIGYGVRPYTMHEAQTLADSVRRDVARHGTAVLDTYAVNT